MNKFIVVALDRYQRKDVSSHTLPKKPTLVSSKTVNTRYTPFLVDQQGLGETQAMPQMEPRRKDTTPSPPPPPPPPPGRRKAKKITKWLSY
jgi:hypothetical protein